MVKLQRQVYYSKENEEMKIKHNVTGKVCICDDYVGARDNNGWFAIEIPDLMKNYSIIKE